MRFAQSIFQGAAPIEPGLVGAVCAIASSHHRRLRRHGAWIRENCPGSRTLRRNPGGDGCSWTPSDELDDDPRGIRRRSCSLARCFNSHHSGADGSNTGGSCFDCSPSERFQLDQAPQRNPLRSESDRGGPGEQDRRGLLPNALDGTAHEKDVGWIEHWNLTDPVTSTTGKALFHLRFRKLPMALA